ncbi:type VI secretion system-associated lipoprotein [Chromobacterium sp. ATCC 53434]|uniref:type VI secretion lipoprotein TssJ n=1 Tax=Chromobacterium sp. (strain ATCC 53434 / SC 14030) TaxID=2059672 RepID=UPI000C78F569|nr:type VI secretion lipoprotein TssJ [Chromobacterium sp. ATCC 53434]AUH51030.1 type VI secretion system-associated lipoprotein [Chromobacterium sp. ATCC 53434]
MAPVPVILLRVSLICALAGLSGCSTLLSLFSSRDGEAPRELHVTLMGGGQLNNNGNGPRPVQVCIYVVRDASWLPSSDFDDSSCTPRERSREVLTSARSVIAPDQAQQLLLPASGTDPVWLLVDADFAARPPDYAPLRIRVDGRQLIHLAVLLDRNRLYDALHPAAPPPRDSARKPAGKAR